MTKVRNLRTLLNSLCEETEGERVSVEDLLRAAGRRSYGPILLLLGFIAVSPLTIVPGANWLVAVLILIVAGQIVIGRSFPWVPSRFLRFSFERKYLVQGVDAAQEAAAVVDRLVAPRFTFLTEPPFVQLVALICIAAALVTFPLGFFPLGPVLPGLTVLLFGLGLTARDGIVIFLAGGALAGALAILTRLLL
ncbi:MAG: exopolysaccharide biosynthesis protein [Pseudomonadota bacterium]